MPVNRSIGQQVRINLIGYGVEIVKTDLAPDLLKRIEKQLLIHNSNLDIAFFENEFIADLNILGKTKWQDFNSIYHMKGLYNHSKSKIEIRVDGKKKASLVFNQILAQQYLFPIYNIENTIADREVKGHKNIFIVEEEVGVVGRIKFETDKFDVSDLKLCTTTIKVLQNHSYTVLDRIYYKGRLLKSEKSDTLVSGQYGCLA
jgi:hypothetical protein